MNIEIESATMQQEQSLEHVKLAANDEQRLIRSLQETATSTEAPLTDWTQARLSTSSYMTYEGTGMNAQRF